MVPVCLSKDRSYAHISNFALRVRQFALKSCNRSSPQLEITEEYRKLKQEKNTVRTKQHKKNSVTSYIIHTTTCRHNFKLYYLSLRLATLSVIHPIQLPRPNVLLKAKLCCRLFKLNLYYFNFKNSILNITNCKISSILQEHRRFSMKDQYQVTLHAKKRVSRVLSRNKVPETLQICVVLILIFCKFTNYNEL